MVILFFPHCYVIVTQIIIIFRGNFFRTEFSHLGEIRSLLSSSVHVMALTATATKTSRRAICRVLGMQAPLIISESPNKPNIKYSVIPKSAPFEESLAFLVEELESKRANVDKTIIFCRTYETVTAIYRYFKANLRESMTEPPGFPDLACFRMVDMFTACTHMDVKKSILCSFVQPTHHLRIIIATVAFRMGLDCSNIRRVIHWAPPDDLESYLQETGRASRDGNPAFAVMYYNDADISRTHVTQQMKDYCRLKDSCRREFLLKDFDGEQNFMITRCKCCDICGLICECIDCSVL